MLIFKYIFIVIIISSTLLSYANSTSQKNIPDQFDRYVFAMTWSNGFCKENPLKPECSNINKKIDTDKNYAITLHGLWPSLNFSTDYSFCHHPVYKKYNNQAVNALLLQYYMPAVNYCSTGFCLPKHEWNKHGICQTKWDQPEYFFIQTKILSVMRKTLLPFLINKNEIKKTDLLNYITKAIDHNADKYINLRCDKSTGLLTEIWFNLSKNIENIAPNNWLNLSLDDLKPYFIKLTNNYTKCHNNIVLK